MVVSGAVAIAAAWVSANAGSGRELLFSAPIQKLDRGTETVTVLGRTFHAQTAQLNVGEVVKVYGTLEKDGSVGDALVQGTNTFGANGDSVFLKGVVTNSDPALGRIEVDGLTVDYTSQLGNSQFVVPAPGDVIALSGMQPTNQDLLVASATGDAAYDVQTGATGGFASVRASQLVGTGNGSSAAQLVGAGGGAAQLVGAGGGAAQLVGAGGGAAQLVGAGGGAAQLVGAGGGRGAAQLVGAGGGK